MSPEDLVRTGMSSVPGFSPKKLREVRDHFGGWAAAAQAAGSRGFPPSISPKIKNALLEAKQVGERVLEQCVDLEIEVLFRASEGWPEALDALPDPPEVLFVKGRRAGLDELAVGIVGSRECSPSGRSWAHTTSAEMASAGWAIVSGLARGIDAAAHRGALTAGTTIAVLGAGIARPYPEEHGHLLCEIAESGLVVSEFAPRVSPRKWHFPRRNRVLAALSRAIVVVECRARSGALVTAREALELGKDVFAVPGWPGVDTSTGPLSLLRSGATPVRHAGDLIEDLGGLSGADPLLSPVSRELGGLETADVSSPDSLARKLGIPLSEANEKLARWELLGLLPPTSGGTP